MYYSATEFFDRDRCGAVAYRHSNRPDSRLPTPDCLGRCIRVAYLVYGLRTLLWSHSRRRTLYARSAAIQTRRRRAADSLYNSAGRVVERIGFRSSLPVARIAGRVRVSKQGILIGLITMGLFYVGYGTYKKNFAVLRGWQQNALHASFML